MFPSTISRIDNESKTRDVHNSVLLGQEGVPVRVGETDGDGLDAVHVHLLLHHDQGQIVTLEDIVELGGSVPARMDDDPLNCRSRSLNNVFNVYNFTIVISGWC